MSEQSPSAVAFPKPAQHAGVAASWALVARLSQGTFVSLIGQNARTPGRNRGGQWNCSSMCRCPWFWLSWRCKHQLHCRWSASTRLPLLWPLNQGKLPLHCRWSARTCLHLLWLSQRSKRQNPRISGSLEMSSLWSWSWQNRRSRLGRDIALCRGPWCPPSGKRLSLSSLHSALLLWFPYNYFRRGNTDLHCHPCSPLHPLRRHLRSSRPQLWTKHHSAKCHFTPHLDTI